MVLDYLASKEKVANATRRDYPGLNNMKMGVISTNSLRQKLAIVTVPETTACKLFHCGKTKIAWIICTIRRRTVPTRCFKCWVSGHMAKVC